MPTYEEWYEQTNDNKLSKSLPTINWGRGRLSGYSSYIAFAAKFCRLNLLTSKQFRTFWVTYARSSNGWDPERIAFILDEPLEVVSTVFGVNSFNFGHFSIFKDKNFWLGDVSYCPKCIADGYHSHFHEMRWLKSCPIHEVSLKLEKIPNSLSVPQIDSEVLTLTRLLDTTSPGWEHSEGQWRAAIKKPFIFRQFLHWESKTQKITQKWLLNCVEILDYKSLSFQTGGGRYCLQHLDILLGRLYSISPFPKRIAALFLDAPAYCEPHILSYDKKLADEFHKINSSFSFTLLINLYRLTYNFYDSRLKFQLDAVTATGLFKSHHPNLRCNCNWCRDIYGVWKPISPGNVSEYWSYLCPYEIAAAELYDEWIRVLAEPKRQRGNKLLGYTKMAYEIEKSGLVSRICKGQSFFESKDGLNLKFNWSKQMAGLVEDILEKALEGHIDELKLWLSAIVEGTPPYLRDYLPPNIYLIQKGDSDFQLISW